MASAVEPAFDFSAEREAASARARGVVVDGAVPVGSVAEAGVRAAKFLESARTLDLTDVVDRSGIAGVADSTAAETAFGAASAPRAEDAGVRLAAEATGATGATEVTEATEAAAARGRAGTLAAPGMNPLNKSEIAVRTASSADCRLLVMTDETDASRTAGSALVTAVI